MPQIDRYLKGLERFGAKAVMLVSEQPVALRFDEGDRFSSQVTAHQELMTMVGEIAPPAVKPAVFEKPESEFWYELEGKHYLVRVQAAPGAWSVALVPGAAPPPSAQSQRPGGTAVQRKAGAAPEQAPSGTSVQKKAGAPEQKPGGTGVQKKVGAPEQPSSGTGVQRKVGGPHEQSPSGTAVQRKVGGAPDQAAAGASATEGAEAQPEAPAENPEEKHDKAVDAAFASIEVSELKAIEKLLVLMKELGGSDLHVTTGAQPIIRLHGSMTPLRRFPQFTAEDLLAQLYEITPEKNRLEFEERNDTDFAHAIPGVSRFRSNIFRDRQGPAAVFRVIPFKIRSASDLGIPTKVLELCFLTKGLVVVTGPTGSGKSTTLAALVDHINLNRDDHIITIEDPVEFVHPNKRCLVNQREVHTDTRSFKDALRAALREDPDIVLVGEMRDLETVAIAVETAETGHLVFGTLHTTTAPSTVDRVIDQFPSDRQDQIRQMVAESLRGVIAQCLCKTKDGGRAAAYEILIGSAAVSNLIREKKTFQLFSLMQTNRAQGMVTLNDSLIELVKSGRVDPREAYSKSVQRHEFKSMLAQHGFKLELPTK